jgi:hypothetical protein
MIMRTTRRLVLAAGVTVMTIGGTTGTIGAARAEVFEHLATKGNSALAFFDQMTPIACADGTTGTVETFVGISANESVSRSVRLPDTDTNTVFAVASISDSCTGDFVVGSTTLDNAFTQTALQTARIATTLSLTDFDGNVVATLVVNLTLDGTGPTTMRTIHDRFQFDDPGGPVVVTEHSIGKERDAIPSGSVVLDGTELIGTFFSGALQMVRSGSIEIQK